MEDEFEALKPAGVGPEMERWNVEDLQAYIDSMKAEILWTVNFSHRCM